MRFIKNAQTVETTCLIIKNTAQKKFCHVISLPLHNFHVQLGEL